MFCTKHSWSLLKIVFLLLATGSLQGIRGQKMFYPSDFSLHHTISIKQIALQWLVMFLPLYDLTWGSWWLTEVLSSKMSTPINFPPSIIIALVFSSDGVVCCGIPLTSRHSLRSYWFFSLLWVRWLWSCNCNEACCFSKVWAANFQTTVLSCLHYLSSFS